MNRVGGWVYSRGGLFLRTRKAVGLPYTDRADSIYCFLASRAHVQARGPATTIIVWMLERTQDGNDEADVIPNVFIFIIQIQKQFSHLPKRINGNSLGWAYSTTRAFVDAYYWCIGMCVCLARSPMLWVVAS